ncbi:hypothetical protein [Litoreibacter roseus]|uniref:Uncharacterized protein n=1 Tax=Litoreibacter roseus TaxID=2601869 RepID=A0A6N6JGN7_9RHOB|nr:hypothetical protein [Litoreibacter roseus]GFE64448.1 hypothetical protein KIN_15220 [Litoreibacter roseus]
MTKHARFWNALDLLADAAPANMPRVVMTGSEDDLRTGLLQEIDQTILTRILSFSTNTGTALEVTVSSRRIIEGASGKDGFETLVSEIGYLVEGADTLFVVAHRTAHAADPTEPGVAVSRLAEHMSIDLSDPIRAKKLSPMDHFVASAQPTLLAWLVFCDGDLSHKYGETDPLAKLEEVFGASSDDIIEELTQILQGSTEPACLILDASPVADSKVLVSKIENELLIAFVGADHATSIASHWYALQN